MSFRAAVSGKCGRPPDGLLVGLLVEQDREIERERERECSRLLVYQMPSVQHCFGFSTSHAPWFLSSFLYCLPVAMCLFSFCLAACLLCSAWRWPITWPSTPLPPPSLPSSSCIPLCLSPACPCRCCACAVWRLAALFMYMSHCIAYLKGQPSDYALLECDVTKQGCEQAKLQQHQKNFADTVVY